MDTVAPDWEIILQGHGKGGQELNTSPRFSHAQGPLIWQDCPLVGRLLPIFKQTNLSQPQTPWPLVLSSSWWWLHPGRKSGAGLADEERLMFCEPDWGVTHGECQSDSLGNICHLKLKA